MKILVEGSSEKIKGLSGAFQFLGHDTWFLHRKHKSVHDVFYELKPNLFIYDSPTNMEDVEAGKKYGVGLVNIGLDKLRLDAVHYYWCKLAANIAHRSGGKFNKRISSEVFIPTFDGCFNHLDILSYIENIELDKKILGNHPCMSPFYLGSLSGKEEADAFCSCLLLLDFHGQFAYDSAINKVPCLVYNWNQEEHPAELINYGNYNQQPEHVDFNPETRKFAINNTYFHRAIELLDSLSISTSSEKNKRDQICKKLLES